SHPRWGPSSGGGRCSGAHPHPPTRTDGRDYYRLHWCPIRISSRTPRGGDAIMLHEATMLRIGDRIAITYRRRSVLIWCAVTVLLLSLAIATLMFGPRGISPAELVEVVRGQARATTEFALQRVRG